MLLRRKFTETIISSQVQHDLTEALKVQEETNQRLQSKIKSYENELDKFKRDLNLETKAREDAQNRLSEMMGRQLKTNNPAITDLSDPDRPLNLVDKFSNIYDNEWTDTIEEIEKITGDESTATKILLTLVTDTYTECYNLRHKGNVWLQLEDRITSVKQKVNGVPEDIKNVLKQMKVEQLQSLKQAILNKMNAEVDRKVLTCLTKSKKQYLDKCLEVCWMMVCHSPPVHLEWNYKGHSFDLQILKPFTESGDMVDFVVWPVTFLHKDGPLLCKGVAQGAQSSQVVSAKSRQTHF